MEDVTWLFVSQDDLVSVDLSVSAELEDWDFIKNERVEEFIGLSNHCSSMNINQNILFL